MLRDELENRLLSESIDTIAVYRIEGDHYTSVVVVGNSTYIHDSVPQDTPSRLAGQPEYAQTSDGIYATFYMPVFRDGAGDRAPRPAESVQPRLPGNPLPEVQHRHRAVRAGAVPLLVAARASMRRACSGRAPTP